MAVGGELAVILFNKKGEKMKLGIKLNLSTFRTATISDDFSINFAEISNLQNWNDDITVSADVVSELEMYYHDGERYLGVDTTNPVQQPEDEFYDDDVDRPSLSTYISFNCVVSDSDLSTILKLINLGIVELDQFGKTNMIVYRLNDERHKLNKSLTPVTILEGKFSAPLGIKSLELDVVNYDLDNSYNYIYIPKLKRYYYVTNIQLTTKDYTKLILQEDVLMSWATLIRSQNAFIVRQENDYDDKLFDSRLPLKDVSTVEDITSDITIIPINNLTNVTLNYQFSNAEFHILVTSFSTTQTSDNDTNPYIAPSGSGLPNLTSSHGDYEWFTYLDSGGFSALLKAIKDDDATASYVQSIIWLPFDPVNAVDFVTGGVYADDKYLTVNGTWDTVGDPSGAPSMTGRWGSIASGTRGNAPYLIIKDFIYNKDLKGIYVEPYSNYEFYIPFVGWIKVEANKFFNKRILIYYTMDMTTGLSTAYIYNYTDKVLIWSGTCQLGIKVDVNTTNQLENIRQKQANENNMILSLLTSALSIGVGMASENPVAVVGGLLSGGKAINSYVNSNNQIFDRAQVNFGTGESALHSPKDFAIRRTYHEPVTISQSVYANINGYPSNTYASLSAITGYTEIGDIHFDAQSENIYQVEIEEIIALLKNGVIM